MDKEEIARREEEWIPCVDTVEGYQEPLPKPGSVKLNDMPGNLPFAMELALIARRRAILRELDPALLSFNVTLGSNTYSIRFERAS